MSTQSLLCSVLGCNQLKTGNKNYCKKHQSRIDRHGDAEVNKRSKIQIGEKFGRLTVVKLTGKDKSGNSLYQCRCHCGGETITRSFSLRNGRAKSCGCLQKEIASQKKSRITLTEKKCSFCGEIKPINQFGRKKESVDGHKSQCRPCGKIWHKNNRHRVSESNRHRRRKMDDATPTWVDRSELQRLEAERVKIENDTGVRYEIDHIIPIKHPLICGLHVPWNLQIVTAQYNNSKGNRVSYEFLQANGRGTNSAKQRKPELVSKFANVTRLWNTRRNKPLMPNMVHVTCPIVVWWTCDRGHDWVKSVPNMLKNHACPVCQGKEDVGFNNNTISPKIAEQWDYTKNDPWKPEDFSRKSGKEVYWICEHNHSYKKSIGARAVGVGCPLCAELGIRKKRTKFSEKTEVFIFENQKGNVYEGTIQAFAEKFHLSPSAVHRVVKGEQLSHKGYFLQGHNPIKNLAQVELTHPTLGQFNGSVPDMVKTHGVNRNSIYKVVNGQAFSHRGWKLLGSERPQKLITVEHPNYGTFEGTAAEFVRKYHGLTYVGVSRLIQKKIFTHRGWRLPGRTKPQKIIKLTHPDHGVFVGQASELIEKFPNLDSGGISKVSRGIQSNHKGWKKC